MTDTLQGYSDTLRNQTKIIPKDLTDKEKLKEKALDTFGNLADPMIIDSVEDLSGKAVGKVKDMLKKGKSELGQGLADVIDQGQKKGLKGALKEVKSQAQKKIKNTLEDRFPSGLKITEPTKKGQVRVRKPYQPKAPQTQDFNNPAFRTFEDDEQEELQKQIDKLRPSQESINSLKGETPKEFNIASAPKGEISFQDRVDAAILDKRLKAPIPSAIEPTGETSTLQKVQKIATAGKVEPGGSVLAQIEKGGTKEGVSMLDSLNPSKVVSTGKSILGTVGEELPGAGLAGALGALGGGKTTKQRITGALKGIGTNEAQSALDEGKAQVKSRLKQALKAGGRDALETEAGESEIGSFLDPVADVVGLAVGLGGMLGSLFHKPKEPQVQHINSSYQVGLG